MTTRRRAGLAPEEAAAAEAAAATEAAAAEAAAATEAAPATEAEPAEAAAETLVSERETVADPDPDRRADRAGQGPGELTVALSPRQIVGGFALLAALILLLRRRNRRRDGD